MNDATPPLQRMMIEAADNVTFQQQLGQDGGAIVLMNVFRFAAEDKAAVMDAWARDSAFMKAQPGFISAQLHEGFAGSNVLFNYAQWESVAALRNAVRSPGFLEQIRHYPASVRSSPHVYQAIAVPGVCLGQAPAGEG